MVAAGGIIAADLILLLLGGPDLGVPERGREVQEAEGILGNDHLGAAEVGDRRVGGAAARDELDDVVEAHGLFEHGARVAGVEGREVGLDAPGGGGSVAQLGVEVGLQLGLDVLPHGEEEDEETQGVAGGAVAA